MPTPPTSVVRRDTSALAVAALVAVCAAAFVLAPTPAHGSSSGASPGFAGNITLSDGEPQTCNVCHNRPFDLNSGSGGVTISAPGSAVVGETVTVTVTVDNQTEGGKRQGFQATVRDADGDLQGALVVTDAAETKLVGSDDYVTHTNTASSSWSFDWTVGEESGVARIYAAGNAANGNNSTSGDHIYTTVAEVAIVATSAEPRPQPAFTVSAPRPHPVRAGASASVAVSLDRPGRLAARLVDGLGRTVRTLTEAGEVAGQEVRVETAGLAPGTYFVVVDGPGGRRTRPLAVVR